MSPRVSLLRPEPGIAITGLGAVTGLGIGVSPLVDRILGAPPENPEDEGVGVAAADPLEPRAVAGFMDPNRARRLDALSLAAVIAAALAVEDAGWQRGTRETPRLDVAVSFGSAWGCFGTARRYAEKLVHQGARFTNPIDFPDSIDGAPAAHIALELGLGGACTTHMDGAVAGEMALLQGLMALCAGRSRRVLVSAGDWTGPGPGLGAAPLPGAGFGLGCLALEHLAGARERGARVYAEVKLMALACPAGRPYRATPSAVHARTLEEALAARQGPPVAIDLLSLGSGDPRFAGLERAALERCLGDRGSPQDVLDVSPWLGQGWAVGILRLLVAGVALHRPEPKYRNVLHSTLATGGASLAVLLEAPSV